jgi:hypothetical protein
MVSTCQSLSNVLMSTSDLLAQTFRRSSLHLRNHRLGDPPRRLPRSRLPQRPARPLLWMHRGRLCRVRCDPHHHQLAIQQLRFAIPTSGQSRNVEHGRTMSLRARFLLLPLHPGTKVYQRDHLELGLPVARSGHLPRHDHLLPTRERQKG